MKSFKYFDLNDNGVVEPDEFAKAIEKIGIQIPTRGDLEMLFSIYDADRSGAIDYKEFSSAVFGRPQSAAPAKFGGEAQAASQDPEALAIKLKEKLASRGARGIIGLQRQFKIMDDDNSKSLNKYEFTKAMNDFQLNFSQGEISILFDYFDVDDNGQCAYGEFTRAIRGPMNPQRKRITAQAFKKLDKDGNGWIDINDIRNVYNATHHPDVQSGKKTEEQILQEFLETFETAHAMRENETPNYVVTKEEFEEYYNNISVGIDDDMYFQLMMENAWKLTEESRQGMGKKGWGADTTEQPRAK
jgi:Ca2+-binding EF-hand superfamily protein